MKLKTMPRRLNHDFLADAKLLKYRDNKQSFIIVAHRPSADPEA